eukprot:Hpha_TRINITY_DN18414_c0_g1::TRINITY_DN18414_c0_g1_i1::g.165358::m.165358
MRKRSIMAVEAVLGKGRREGTTGRMSPTVTGKESPVMMGNEGEEGPAEKVEGYEEHAMPVVRLECFDMPTSNAPALSASAYAVRSHGFGALAVAEKTIQVGPFAMVFCRFDKPGAWLPVEITGSRPDVISPGSTFDETVNVPVKGMKDLLTGGDKEHGDGEDEGGFKEQEEAARVRDPREQRVWEKLVAKHGCIVQQVSEDGTWAFANLKGSVVVQIPVDAVRRVGSF